MWLQKEKQLLVMKAEDFLTNEKKRKPKDLSPSALENQDVSFLSDLFKDVVDGKYKQDNFIYFSRVIQYTTFL